MATTSWDVLDITIDPPAGAPSAWVGVPLGRIGIWLYNISVGRVRVRRS
jgi:hypothetical protein